MTAYFLYSWEILIPRVVSKNPFKVKGVQTITGQNLVTILPDDMWDPGQKLEAHLEHKYGKYKLVKVGCLNI